MVEHFYSYYATYNPEGPFSIEEVYGYQHGPSKIISTYPDEHDYLMAMQMMFQAATIVTFQEFHDDLWSMLSQSRHESLDTCLRQQILFSSDQDLLPCLTSPYGDRIMQKRAKKFTNLYREPAYFDTRGWGI